MPYSILSVFVTTAKAEMQLKPQKEGGKFQSKKKNQ